MTQPTSDRLNLSLVAAILIGLVVAFGTAGFDQYFRTPSLEVGDIAVNALQIENAKHLHEIYGNYSRFEFNHPGPAFFYVYAAGEKVLYDFLGVTRAPGTAHLFASMCLQSFFFALALGLMAVHLPPRIWLPLGLISAALYFGPLHDPFMSIWPPIVLLMPFFCFLVGCCSVGTGRVDHVPYLILAGGFLFHGHVAQPLFVGSLGLLACSLCSRELRRASPGVTWREFAIQHRKVSWICAFLVTVFFLPLLIDVVRDGTKSNVATIIGRFLVNTGDSKTPLQSFLYFVSFATPAQNQEEIFTTMGPQVGEFFRNNAWWVILWACLFSLTPLLSFVCPARLPARERRFLLIGHLFVLVAVADCILWGMAQAGPMAHFNGYFYYGIYFFALLLALGWVDGLVRPTGRMAPFTSGLCAIAAIAFTWSFRLPRWTDSEAGMPIKRAVDDALKNDPKQPKLLVFEHKDWPAVAGVALDLQRQDVGFYTAPWWEFMFGRHGLTRLGDEPEEAAHVWWLTNPGPDGIPLSPTLSLFTSPGPIQPDGDEIRFRTGDNGFRYVVSGISAGNVDFAWTELPRVVLLFAPQPTTHDVSITLDAQSALRGPNGAIPQPGVVFFNGQKVGTVVAGDRSLLAITLPRDLWNREARGKLELRFPEAVRYNKFKRPRYEWWMSWGIWAIRFTPAS